MFDAEVHKIRKSSEVETMSSIVQSFAMSGDLLMLSRHGDLDRHGATPITYRWMVDFMGNPIYK